MADADGTPPRRIAWVTGASRGVGRGVAVALGQAGWVVYVTARSSADGRTGHLPGTVEQTADAVTEAGGLGVAVPCDHRDDAAVRAVAARITADHGRLDLLVNNAWAGYERLNAGGWEEWNAPFWEQPLELFDAMFGGGVRTHYVAAAVSAPLLIATPRSLVVTVSVAVPETEQHAFGTAYAMAKTADAVTAAGGLGIAVKCDHRDDAAVRAVAARITADHGRLDLLVNNAWAGYERLNAGGWQEWNAPFWEQPLELFDAMFSGGVRAHYVAAAVTAPLLIATPQSLVVTVSVAVPETEQHAFGAAYAMAKTADDRLALAAAIQLGEHGVASVAVHPDWVRTEGVLQFADQADLSASQSPEGVGRAIAALAGDPEVMSLTGQALTVRALAARYGVDVSS